MPGIQAEIAAADATLQSIAAERAEADAIQARVADLLAADAARRAASAAVQRGGDGGVGAAAAACVPLQLVELQDAAGAPAAETSTAAMLVRRPPGHLLGHQLGLASCFS